MNPLGDTVNENNSVSRPSGPVCTVGSGFTTGLRFRIFGRKPNRRKTSTI